MPMLTFGEAISVNTDQLPPASVSALLSRGFGHLMGNEQASKVVGRIRREIVNGSDRKADSVTTEEVKAFRASNGSAVVAWEAEARQAAVEALLAGTIGERAPGQPRLDPLEAMIQRVAKESVVATLKAQGLKFPKDGATITLGAGTDRELQRTGPEMIANRLASPKFGPIIRKEAEKRIADAKRLAKASEGDGEDEAL